MRITTLLTAAAAATCFAGVASATTIFTPGGAGGVATSTSITNVTVTSNGAGFSGGLANDHGGATGNATLNINTSSPGNTTYTSTVSGNSTNTAFTLGGGTAGTTTSIGAGGASSGTGFVTPPFFYHN